jgi:hypothetical protein
MMYPAAQIETHTPRELLPEFYKQYELGEDGGQSSPYVRIGLTKKLVLYCPNFDIRREAVFKHDVHHIVTGYTSTLKGETEIGAWEIASGCRRYWIAFVLDMSAVMMGTLFNPIGVYKAFVKGRRTRNLYTDTYTDEQLMDMPVRDIKRSLLLDNYPEKNTGNLADLFLFIFLLLFGTIYSIFSLVLLPFLLVYTLIVVIKNRKKHPA